MKHILIADDHAVTRRGVRDILQEAFEGLEVTEAVDVPTALGALEARAWDLIVVDVMMPGGTVLDLLASIRAKRPAVPILVLTAVTELEYVVQTMKAGANGLIHKHRASDELLEAVKRVAAGGTYLHAESAAAIAQSLREQASRPHMLLSAREMEIFRLIALGMAIKEIGGRLKLSEKTVATYLARIRDKTGLMTHVEIARYALQNGLVD